MLKSGIYDFVICRGGTDMCFVLGFGRKRLDLKQYRISGLTPGKSHGQGPWVSHERHRLDDSSSANKRIRSCSILFLVDAITGKAKTGAHKARVTDGVLDDLDVSPPSPYILG